MTIETHGVSQLFVDIGAAVIQLALLTRIATRWAPVERVVLPQLEVPSFYEERYGIFRKLYTSTAPLMNQLGMQVRSLASS